MHLLTAGWRALHVVLHVLVGALVTLGVTPFRRLRLPDPRFTRLVRWWYGRLCRLLGLTVHVRGQPDEAVLLVANHVSWLDIPVLGARGPIVFLSKAEVRSWPLVGWMAGITSTLYIERGAHQATQLAADIGMQIRTGCSVAIFPEGTTGDGHDLRRFHPRLFAAAQQPGLRLQPVAIRYGSNTAPDAVAPFIGDDSLLPHLWRVLRRPGIRVELSFLPSLDPDGVDRRRLAEGSRAAIAGALGLDPARDAAAGGAGTGRAWPSRAAAVR